MASGQWGPRAWLAVMAIIGAVQLVRQQWFAAGLFLLAAIVLAVDLIGPRHPTASRWRPARRQGHDRAPRGTPSRRPAALRLTVLVPVAAVVTVVLTILTRHSGAMVAALAPVGMAVFALGWPGDRTGADPSPASPTKARTTSTGHGARPRAATDAGAVTAAPADRWPVALRHLAWAWAAIWIAGGLWELAQVLLVDLGLDPAAIPLSDLLEPALETRVGQGVFVLLWVLGGVYLLRRGRQSC